MLIGAIKTHAHTITINNTVNVTKPINIATKIIVQIVIFMLSLSERYCMIYQSSVQCD